MLRLHASNGAPRQWRLDANHAMSGCQGRIMQESGSGRAATSSSLTSCGTPSSAAPVNSSEPPIIRSKCEIGTILALEAPCMSA